MVFLKVIPTALLFIHGSAGHCNLETGMCACLCARDEFYKRGKGGETHRREKWRGREKKRSGEGREGGMEGKDEGCGLEYGFGFPSLRGEWKAIDSEAESKADRVAARGCTGTQWEHDLDTNKVSARPLTGQRDEKEREKRVEKDGWKKKKVKEEAEGQWTGGKQGLKMQPNYFSSPWQNEVGAAGRTEIDMMKEVRQGYVVME